MKYWRHFWTSTTLYKGEYYISMPNIGAHNLDETYVFTCDDFEVHYSGRSYVNQLLKAYQSGPEHDLARALYRYSEAAENYLAD